MSRPLLALKPRSLALFAFVIIMLVFLWGEIDGAAASDDLLVKL